MKIEKITLENGKVKGTDVVPTKIGTTEEIYVPLRENGFFGGSVQLDKEGSFQSSIESRLRTLQPWDGVDNEYSGVNAFAKARRNSKKYNKMGTLTEYLYAFIDFYKV